MTAPAVDSAAAPSGGLFDRRKGEDVKWISFLVIALTNVAAIAWFAATLSASVEQLERDSAARTMMFQALVTQVGKNSTDIEILKDRESRKGVR